MATRKCSSLKSHPCSNLCHSRKQDLLHFSFYFYLNYYVNYIEGLGKKLFSKHIMRVELNNIPLIREFAFTSFLKHEYKNNKVFFMFSLWNPPPNGTCLILYFFFNWLALLSWPANVTPSAPLRSSDSVQPTNEAGSRAPCCSSRPFSCYTDTLDQHFVKFELICASIPECLFDLDTCRHKKTNNKKNLFGNLKASQASGLIIRLCHLGSMTYYWSFVILQSCNKRFNFL